MDFDFAAKRLAKDHSKLKGSRLRGGAVGRGRNTPRDVSAKAKREAAIRKRQQERLASEKRARQQQLEWQKQLFRQCNRSLGVRSLNDRQGQGNNNSPLALTATSIHGEGDKIALPPSILEFLTAADFDAPGGGGGRTNLSSPWTFRIGVLNPDYQFPASRLLKTMSVEATQDSSEGDNSRDDDVMEDADDEDDDDNNSTKRNEAYLDELARQYLAYTHGTVVEFTQEEGHVGLPKPIAMALLTQHAAQQQQQDKIVGSETILTTEATIRIPATRTVDPATSRKTTTVDAMETVENDTDTTTNHNYNEEEEENTPGHLAWGAFDVPALPIEVTLVQLPKGIACKLAPTVHAVRSGFYNLRNIKSVLEQSLVRSRATLSVGDTVHTWHRGVKYDLTVSTVTPATYNAVTCINTDIEVEFGPAPEMEQDDDNNNNEMKVDNNSSADENKCNSNVNGKETGESKGRVLGAGRRLNSPSPLPVSAEGSGKTNDTTTTTTAQRDSPGKPSMRELALAAAERRARENKG